MGQRGLRVIVGSFGVLFVLVSAAWLAAGVEGIRGILPPESDKIGIQVLSPNVVQLSYRLPRGLTWDAVYERLTAQGWVMQDDELLVWPDLMDDGHTRAVFIRSGWLPLGRQRLAVHRDLLDPRRWVVELRQCVPLVLLVACS